jgi:hypothetical protein
MKKSIDNRILKSHVKPLVAQAAGLRTRRLESLGYY